MNRRVFTVLIIGIMLAAALPLSMNGIQAASARTIYVPDNYATIQEAVDAAVSGDTIIVRDGTYSENVVIAKDQLTIQSENGSEFTTVQAVQTGNPVFHVTSDYVSIDGFTIKGATAVQDVGAIHLDGAEYCNISNNYLVDNRNGIYLHKSDYNSIADNQASNNIGNGFYVDEANYNTWTGNIASHNRNGILISFSIGNDFINNTMYENKWNFGITGFSYSHYIQNIDTSNTVDGKPIYHWVDLRDGEVRQIPADAGYVVLVSCTNVIVKDLTLMNNLHGVLLVYSDNIRIENTEFGGNVYTFELIHSDDNVIVNNTILPTSMYVMNIKWLNNNIVYLNDIYKTYVLSDISETFWSSTEEISYTYDGSTYTNYMGNYWSNYAGSDANGDGIGDTPFTATSVTDDYPLMKPTEYYEVSDVHVLDVHGDVNGDGNVNMLDVMTLWYTIAEYPEPGVGEIYSQWAADVNCDRQINMTDVMTLWYEIADYPEPGAWQVNCCE